MGILLGYDPVSDRIMVVRLEGKPFQLILVLVYAQTNQAFEGDKTQFYEQLQDVIDQLLPPCCAFQVIQWN